MTTALLIAAGWTAVIALALFGWHRLVKAHRKGPP